MNKAAIHYQVTPENPQSHLFSVQCQIQSPNQNGQEVSMATWIPGSYLIRDFAKHIINLRVETLDGQSLTIRPLSKSRWLIEPCDSALVIYYQVYAWDLSVRGAHFDATHGFFNGTSVFLAIEGQRDQPCSVLIEETSHTRENNWQIATTLPTLSVDSNGYGSYQSTDYWDLIEYPVEMGRFHRLKFNAAGIPHEMVLTGRVNFDQLDEARLIADLTQICETELALFEKPYPIDRYLFHVTVTEKDYGGLEHVNSTALICARDDLPYRQDEKRTTGYIRFLELCSHEYFHLWNVKRIQPKVYQRPSLLEPVYTNQLWWFEGITSYYDCQFLYRAGILSREAYLNQLAMEMTRVYRMPGRFKQSVAESSWLTWTKFYQQDENAPNAIVSYYNKGGLIALALDLIIQAETDGQKSLDTVLLHLWQHYGQTATGLEDGDIEQICSQVSGIDLSHFFETALYGTEDLDFESLFEPFGIQFSLRAATELKDQGGKTSLNNPPPSLGVNGQQTEHQTLLLTHVWQAQPAAQAGLAAGDEMIALDGLRVKSLEGFEKLLSRYQPGDTLSCAFFRRDELMQTDILLQAPVKDRVALSDLDAAQRSFLPWPTK